LRKSDSQEESAPRSSTKQLVKLAAAGFHTKSMFLAQANLSSLGINPKHPILKI
jgi:hypothetical protein